MVAKVGNQGFNQAPVGSGPYKVKAWQRGVQVELEANEGCWRGKRRVVLKGELPSPSNIPRGCAFHTRCPIAVARCRSETPQLIRQVDGAEVACHLVQLGADGGSS